MDYRVLMTLVSELGSRLAVAGAETYRIEESIIRVLHTYGLEGRVYSVPNSLFITIMIPDQLPVTQLCRMTDLGTDLDAVEKYSNVSRRICSEKPDPQTALQWLRNAEHDRKNYSFPTVLLGHILVAGGLCVFYGGSAADCFCAVLCGLFLGFVDKWLSRVNSNAFFQKITSAFLMALFAYLLAEFGLSNCIDTSVIGTLMLLVPGLLFTNALRDIMFGDTNSGVNRVVTALLLASAVALGTAAAWNTAEYLWGIPAAAQPLVHSDLVACTATLAACIGFLFVWNIHGSGAILCAVGGFLTWAVFCLTDRFGAGYPMCCFVGTLAAATYAEIMARIRKYPAISYLVVSLVPLIPGSYIYYTAQQAVLGNMDGFVHQGVQTLITAGVMAVGIILISSTFRILHPRHLPHRTHK